MDESKSITDVGISPPQAADSDAAPRYGRPLVEPPVMRSVAESSRMAFIALATAGSLFNFLAVPVLDGSRGGDGWLIGPIVVGIWLGQVGAMACWLVWGEGPFLRRLAIHWGVGALLMLCMLTGIASVTSVAQNYPWILAPFCLIPMVSLAAQFPLWPLRTHLGWRVAVSGNEFASEKPKALSILDILSGTAVVALSLGLVRAAQIGPADYLWSELAVTVVVVIGASTILLPPAMIFVLRTKEAAIGIAMLFGYSFLAAILLMALASVFSGGGPPGEVVFALLLGCCAFTATMAAPLFVWRGCGYRLVWPRDRR